MKQVEKISYYLIGGIVGFIAGKVLYIDLVAASLVGVIASIFIKQYRSNQKNTENSHTKDETVALITHEMRTGLTSTGWAIQLILEKYHDSISEEDRKMLHSVANSISTTVMHSVNLLDVSMLDIGKLNISLEWKSMADIKMLFDETLEKYVYGARKKGVTLTSDIKLDGQRGVEVDMLRLRIIIENLLENALQYTLGDKKEIFIFANTTQNDLNITVKDTGIGIPAAEQTNIYTKFFRASNARAKLSSGSGIGLYMCKKYIDAHRGTLRFESKEGKGSAFYITIPLKTIANTTEFLAKI